MRTLTKKEEEFAEEYLIDDSRIIGVESRVLLRLEDVLKKCKYETYDGYALDRKSTIEFPGFPHTAGDASDYPCIVSHMKRYFGNNKFREYFVYSKRTPEGYTHIDKKGDYYYCEEWFEPKVLLEDGLFEI